MSGPLPSYLTRRDAVYIIRLQIPADLAERLGTRELRRSLGTKNIDVAKSRCLDATVWFRELVPLLRSMGEITRADLEAAAQDFFAGLIRETDVPRGADRSSDHWAYDIATNIDESRRFIRELEDQLRDNRFSGVIDKQASDLLVSLRGSLDGLDGHLQLLARQLVVKAHRQRHRYFVHQLTDPGLPFTADDPTFDPEVRKASISTLARLIEPLETIAAPSRYPTLADMVSLFLAHLGEKTGASHVDESTRALGWLMEQIEPTTAMDRITVDQVREFRDNIRRMDKTGQGKKRPFRLRLTDVRERQITHATVVKYWGAVRGLFQWAVSEGRAPTDPTERLKLDRKKGEERRSPPPFSKDELQRFFKTPLYVGYQSPFRTRAPGPCVSRGQHWWAGVLPLFTGLRAGELSQLLPSDFQFDAPIPHIRVQEFDETGARTKSTKTASSTRDVPVAPILLELGLRQFVERRRKVQPKARVFDKFRLGTGGKLSEGMARYWGDFLRQYELHKDGRATHVMRHTVIARLRALETAEEDISAFVGHAHGSITSKYGGAYPLERKLKVAEKLDYGFDLLKALGGPYQEKLHRA